MASWYAPFSFSELCSYLESLNLAPGVLEGFRLLKEYAVRIAIVSITWEFAVEWFARRLGADYYVGTKLLSTGEIQHFWPQDKSNWLADLTKRIGIRLDNVAAVGDSTSDMYKLRSVGHPCFVGQNKPHELESTSHYPSGNIHEIAQKIIRLYTA